MTQILQTNEIKKRNNKREKKRNMIKHDDIINYKFKV